MRPLALKLVLDNLEAAPSAARLAVGIDTDLIGRARVECAGLTPPREHPNKVIDDAMTLLGQARYRMAVVRLPDHVDENAWLELLSQLQGIEATVAKILYAGEATP